MSPTLSGVLAPVLTPFQANLEIDVPRFVDHCRSLLADGCSALAVFGTTSEANSLSVEERERLLLALLEAGIPPEKLLPGTGCCALPDTVRLTRAATRAGCAGVLMLPPFYYKNLSDEAVFRSFAAVIDRVADPRLRIFLYHIPNYSQVGIPLAVIQRLRKAYPEIVVGLKDSSGDFSNTRAILDNVPGFQVFVGSERYLLANLRAGGAGCITATANVNAAAIAKAFHDRTEEAQAGIDQVRIFFEQFPMIPALKAELAERRNDPAWRTVRPPLVELPAEALRRAR
ncbi:MAG: dihydrodipicolinate synthase family protein [Deltaproteobacteria bacterium]|nr:MAG: dihydrodipicolinate synthase family protein [Deltaproteobacteria bacterium]